jgi:hypothetical protein
MLVKNKVYAFGVMSDGFEKLFPKYELNQGKSGIIKPEQ